MTIHADIEREVSAYRARIAREIDVIKAEVARLRTMPLPTRNEAARRAAVSAQIEKLRDEVAELRAMPQFMRRPGQLMAKLTQLEDLRKQDQPARPRGVVPELLERLAELRLEQDGVRQRWRLVEKHANGIVAACGSLRRDVADIRRGAHGGGINALDNKIAVVGAMFGRTLTKLYGANVPDELRKYVSAADELHKY
jgi:hypothetical protein